MSSYVKTGKPRGRPKGSKDIAPKVRSLVQKVLLWWSRGERWRKDMEKMSEKDRGMLIARLSELGINAENPRNLESRAGLTVTFLLNGVRDEQTSFRVKCPPPDDQAAAIDVTPSVPALPPADVPRIYTPSREALSRPAAPAPAPVVAEELSEHEREQQKLRLELADKLEALEREPETPEWLRPL